MAKQAEAGRLIHLLQQGKLSQPQLVQLVQQKIDQPPSPSPFVQSPVVQVTTTQPEPEAPPPTASNSCEALKVLYIVQKHNAEVLCPLIPNLLSVWKSKNRYLPLPNHLTSCLSEFLGL